MRRIAITIAAIALAAPAFVTSALAACPDDAAVDALAADLAAMRPATLAAVPETMDDALCMQGKLVERLATEGGEPIGYKVGLTSKPAQERFGATAPVRGVLLDGMIVDDGASVGRFASRGLYEADLLVTVRSDEINLATTPMEVLRHLESVQPFIELADLVVAEGQPLTPETITGFNVGARMGVAGDEVRARATQSFLDELETMTVRLSTSEGGEVMSAPGRAVLGHPLNAVLWLLDDGVKLEAGDVVSLGSFGAPQPAKPGQTVTVAYDGLADSPSVSVTLE